MTFVIKVQISIIKLGLVELAIIPFSGINTFWYLVWIPISDIDTVWYPVCDTEFRYQYFSIPDNKTHFKESILFDT